MTSLAGPTSQPTVHPSTPCLHNKSANDGKWPDKNTFTKKVNDETEELCLSLVMRVAMEDDELVAYHFLDIYTVPQGPLLEGEEGVSEVPDIPLAGAPCHPHLLR